MSWSNTLQLFFDQNVFPVQCEFFVSQGDVENAQKILFDDMRKFFLLPWWKGRSKLSLIRSGYDKSGSN